jgi:hypothetical protein
MTRRDIIRTAGRLSLGAAAFSARLLAASEFWNEVQPQDWNPEQVRELLARSPWAKPAVIDDKGAVGTLAGPRRGRRSNAQGPPGGAAPANAPKIDWKAIVRWESALPVRLAMKDVAVEDFKDFYVLTVIGNLPNAMPTGDPDEVQEALTYLKESTTLSHKGDAVHLDHLDAERHSTLSEAGTRFYFSRKLDLMPKDREAIFETRIGPLIIRCRFPLHDMMYRGQLEL